MIKVLIVDDSLVQQELLTYILSADPRITVVGTAFDGEDAIRKVEKLKPDLVTMDINMPKMNGIDAIRNIMSTHPLPIIVIGANNTEREVSNSILAIEAGAISVIERSSFSPDCNQSLTNTIKLMAEIKVVKRHPSLNKKKLLQNVQHIKPQLEKINLIAMGASTGGPLVLQSIFKGLDGDFPPVLVVQHIADGFLQGLSDWLSLSSNGMVQIASHNDELIRGHIYLAPDGHHMGVNSFNRIVLSSEEAENGHRPSVTYLFRSVAKNFGNKALGILLTGMGRDGADGLKSMKESGAVTVVQDEESSIIYGMPKEALAIDAVSNILSPDEIVQLINGLKNRKV